MSLPVYRGNRNLCLELTRNYLSHPYLVEFASRMFYHNKLSCAADRNVVDSLCGWSKLPNPEFPFAFFGVEGQDMREGDSPSFFNPYEIILVADLVESLQREKKLKPNELAVISPFFKHNIKLRSLLRQRNLRLEYTSLLKVCE